MEKKGNRLRLIFDCRRTNQHFRKPKKVRLFSGASFSLLDVSPSTCVYAGGLDVKDAFYRMELPENLSPFFSLDAVTAGEMGWSHYNGEKVASDFKIFPQLKVVPMGWSWAVYLCQSAIERGVHAAEEIDSRQTARDFAALPSFHRGPVHTVYVDNLIVAAEKQESVASVVTGVQRELESRGLMTHEAELGSFDYRALGFAIGGDPAETRLTRRKWWMLYHSLRAICDLDYVTSKMVEVLVGHITIAALLRRELLSALRSCYDYIAKGYTGRARLWSSVKHELLMIRGLLILLYSDNTAGWSTTVEATDACESGYAVVRTEWSEQEVREAGSTLERWRYKHLEEAGGPLGARSLALEQLFRYRSGAPAGPELQPNPHFEDIKVHLVNEADWTCVSYVPMDGKEPVHMKEMRSVLHSFKSRLGEPSNWGKRFLVLGDNLGVVFAISKGRCTNVPLLYLQRKLAAYTLASGSAGVVRWICSELNPADEDSRRREPPKDGPSGPGQAHVRRAVKQEGQAARTGSPSSLQSRGEEAHFRKGGFEPVQEACGGAHATSSVRGRAATSRSAAGGTSAGVAASGAGADRGSHAPTRSPAGQGNSPHSRAHTHSFSGVQRSDRKGAGREFGEVSIPARFQRLGGRGVCDRHEAGRCQSSGSAPGPVSRQVLLGGPGSEHRHEALVSTAVPPAGVFSLGKHAHSKSFAESEGVEQVVSRKDEEALAVVGGRSHCDSHMLVGLPGDGPILGLDGGHSRAADRDTAVEMSTGDPTNQGCRKVQARRHSPPPGLLRDPVEDGRARRQRPGGSAGSRESHGGLVQPTWSGGTPLEFYTERGANGLPEGVLASRVEPLQPHAISGSALGGQQRHRRATARQCKPSKTGALAHSQVSGAVREARAPAGGLGGARARDVAVCPALRERALAGAARDQAAKAAASQFFFIEILRGLCPAHANVAKPGLPLHCRRHCQWPAPRFDAKAGEAKNSEVAALRALPGRSGRSALHIFFDGPKVGRSWSAAFEDQ